MRYFSFDLGKDAFLLLARILLVALFVVFGWDKLLNISATSAHMAASGVPFPPLATIIAIVMELVVGLAIAVGYYTRPLALLLAVYTIATALLGHHYWTQEGAERMINMINFYKNVSIVGGLLLLWMAGPGRLSLDRR